MSAFNLGLHGNLNRELIAVDMRDTDSPGVEIYPKGSYSHQIASKMGWGYTFKKWAHAQDTMFKKASLQEYINGNLNESNIIDTLAEQEVKDKIVKIANKALDFPNSIKQTAVRFFKSIDMRQTETPGVDFYRDKGVKDYLISAIASNIGRTYTFTKWPLAKDVVLDKESLQKFLSENLNESININDLNENQVLDKVFEVVRLAREQLRRDFAPKQPQVIQDDVPVEEKEVVSRNDALPEIADSKADEEENLIQKIIEEESAKVSQLASQILSENSHVEEVIEENKPIEDFFEKERFVEKIIEEGSPKAQQLSSLILLEKPRRQPEVAAEKSYISDSYFEEIDNDTSWSYQEAPETSEREIEEKKAKTLERFAKSLAKKLSQTRDLTEDSPLESPKEQDKKEEEPLVEKVIEIIEEKVDSEKSLAEDTGAKSEQNDDSSSKKTTATTQKKPKEKGPLTKKVDRVVLPKKSSQIQRLRNVNRTHAPIVRAISSGADLKKSDLREASRMLLSKIVGIQGMISAVQYHKTTELIFEAIRFQSDKKSRQDQKLVSLVETLIANGRPK